MAMAIRYLVFFMRSSHHLSWTMRFFLCEQVVTSGGTMLFSSNSLLATITGTPEAEWNNIDPVMAIAIRAVMFGAMIQSTWHLSASIRKVAEDDVR